MKKLYSGIEVPTTINTNTRIFKVITFDNEMVLCNVDTAQRLLKEQIIKDLFHLCNGKFERFGKIELKDM